MTLSITPFQKGIGATITGIDLSVQPDAATFAEIKTALDSHQLLSFPEQELDATGQVAFAKQFGPLDIHVLEQYNHPDFPEIFMLSNEVVDGKPLGLSDAGSYWHSDFAFRPKPAYVTMLHAKKIPSQGGNTLFADMYAAYDALDPEAPCRPPGCPALSQTRRHVGRWNPCFHDRGSAGEDAGRRPSVGPRPSGNPPSRPFCSHRHNRRDRRVARGRERRSSAQALQSHGRGPLRDGIRVDGARSGVLGQQVHDAQGHVRRVVWRRAADPLSDHLHG